MKNTISTLLGSALLATGIASAHITPANAFTLGSCSTSSVSGSVACGRGDTSQDFVGNSQPLTVNAESFFSFSDWSFGGKIGTANYAGTGSGSGQTGSWNLSSVIQDTWSNVMLVLKGPNNHDLFAYMLGDNVTSGTWTTPFPGPNSNWQDVSHISVYYREGATEPPVTPVPEPATLMGLGLVASGMVMARRRKSSQSA